MITAILAIYLVPGSMAAETAEATVRAEPVTYGAAQSNGFGPLFAVATWRVDEHPDWTPWDSPERATRRALWVSPDGNYVATRSNEGLAILNRETSGQIRVPDVPRRLVPDGSLRDLVFSSDSKLVQILWATEVISLTLPNLDLGDRFRLPAVDGPRWDMFLGRDGSVLTAGPYDNTFLTSWTQESRLLARAGTTWLTTPQRGMIGGLPSIASAYAAGTSVGVGYELSAPRRQLNASVVTVWSPRSGDSRNSRFDGAFESVLDVSEDGGIALLATRSPQSMTCVTLDRDGRRVDLDTHAAGLDYATSASFSWDGMQVAIVDEVKLVVFETETGRVIENHPCVRGCRWVAWVPESEGDRSLFTTDGRDLTWWWDTPDATESRAE